MAQPETSKGVNAALTALAVVVAIFAAVTIIGNLRPAPEAPEYFDAQLPLRSAIDRAREEGRVVLAVATAEWCGPCAVYKKRGLADERVAQWAGQHAVPIMIDIDDRPEEAAALGVAAIPRTVVLRDGEIVAAVEGALPPDMLLEFLDKARRR